MRACVLIQDYAPYWVNQGSNSSQSSSVLLIKTEEDWFSSSTVEVVLS